MFKPFCTPRILVEGESSGMRMFAINFENSQNITPMSKNYETTWDANNLLLKRNWNLAIGDCT